MELMKLYSLIFPKSYSVVLLYFMNFKRNWNKYLLNQYLKLVDNFIQFQLFKFKVFHVKILM